MPFESEKLTEQRRGSNAWALEHLIKGGLGKLIDDLKKREEQGFGEDVCTLVKDALLILATRSATTGGSFAPIVANECDRFRQDYESWNGQGTSSSRNAIVMRRSLIADLVGWRKNMMEFLAQRRKGGRGQASQGDYAFVNEVYAKFSPLVDAYPQIFPGLRQSVERFQAAGRRVGRP